MATLTQLAKVPLGTTLRAAALSSVRPWAKKWERSNVKVDGCGMVSLLGGCKASIGNKSCIFIACFELLIKWVLWRALAVVAVASHR